MKNHSLLLSVMAVALAAGACSHGPEPFGRLTPADVSQKLGHPNVFVYDNNSRSTFDRAHVPGARWVDHSNVQAADLPADKNATLIFYCANDW
ncbi:MAG TPA: rhodanese-like domain-containing protein [Polyangia bacterium]|nr:rhodanese-like domain-containing protein [Polyangia bacterium]